MSDGKLSLKQRKCISALLQYPTYELAALEVGINPKTVSRWLRKESFRIELLRAQSEKIDTVMRPLLQLAPVAVDSLKNVMDNPSQRGASNRRLAAVAVLDQLNRMVDRNLDLRLSILEMKVYDTQ